MNTQVKFLHIRRPSVAVRSDGLTIERAGPFGGITIAYCTFNSEGVYHFAIARCRNDERYSRKLGRQYAIKRLLEEGKFHHFHVEKDESPLEYLAAHVYHSGALRKNLRPAITGASK